MLLTEFGLLDLFEKIKKANIEIINEQNLVDNLKIHKKLKLYMGMEISGILHLGHFTPLNILKLFSKFENCETIVLLSGIHTTLNLKQENLKENLIYSLTKFFPECKIVLASEKSEKYLDYNNFHYSKDYLDNVIALSTITSLKRITRAFSFLKKNSKANSFSCEVLYPLFQIADFVYLNINGIIGGQDQRAIHMSGYTACSAETKKNYTFFHTPILTYYNGKKISKSELVDNQINLEVIRKIMNKMTLVEIKNVVKLFSIIFEIADSDNYKQLINSFLARFTEEYL